MGCVEFVRVRTGFADRLITRESFFEREKLIFGSMNSAVMYRKQTARAGLMEPLRAGSSIRAQPMDHWHRAWRQRSIFRDDHCNVVGGRKIVHKMQQLQVRRIAPLGK